jgi:hypothetical protein
MNISKLTDKEFSELIELLVKNYDSKLPRDVISALFAEVTDDPNHFALGLQERIDRGMTKIDKVIGTRKP